MWKLYSKDGIGVRIGLESETPFGNPGEQLYEKIMQAEDKAKVISDSIGNPHYFDTLMIMNEKVVYDSNPLTKIQEAIKPYRSTKGEEDLMINNNVVGFTKDISWSFQNEYRFLKMILPRDHKTTNLLPTGKFNTGWKETYKLLIEGKGPEEAPGVPLKAVYVPIGKNAFSNMEVILGPCCKVEHRFILDSIFNQLDMKPEISPSCLTGRIRFK